AFVVDDDRRAFAFLNRDAGTRGRIDAVEILDLLEVVDVAFRFRLRDADVADGQPVNLEPVVFALVAQRPMTPAPSDPGGDGAFGQLRGAVGSLLLVSDDEGGKADQNDGNQTRDRLAVHRYSFSLMISSFHRFISVVRRRETLELVQSLHGLHRLERRVIDVRGVQAAPLLERIVRQRHEERLELLLDGYEEPDVVAIPAKVHRGFLWRLLERLRPTVDDHRPCGSVAYGVRDVSLQHGEVDLPVVPADGV